MRPVIASSSVTFTNSRVAESVKLAVVAGDRLAEEMGEGGQSSCADDISGSFYPDALERLEGCDSGNATHDNEQIEGNEDFQHKGLQSTGDQNIWRHRFAALR